MTDDTEKLEWQDLVQSAGWGRLVAAAQREWQGTAFVSLVDNLVDKPDDAEALSKLRQMMAAKRAVERLLNIPHERLALIERQQAAPTGNRRGAL